MANATPTNDTLVFHTLSEEVLETFFGGMEETTARIRARQAPGFTRATILALRRMAERVRWYPWDDEEAAQRRFDVATDFLTECTLEYGW